jgi:hypothetical protein
MTETPSLSPVAVRQRVNYLITNKQYGWTERDRPHLEQLSEAMLIRLESQPIIVPTAEPPAPPREPATVDEAIARLPVQMHDMFRQMHQDYQARRQAALAVLLANQTCPFEQDELQEMTVERLEKLVAMGAGVEYSGKGLPAPPPVVEHREPAPPPPKVLDRVLERQKALGLRA